MLKQSILQKRETVNKICFFIACAVVLQLQQIVCAPGTDLEQFKILAIPKLQILQKRKKKQSCLMQKRNNNKLHDLPFDTGPHNSFAKPRPTDWARLAYISQAILSEKQTTRIPDDSINHGQDMRRGTTRRGREITNVGR